MQSRQFSPLFPTGSEEATLDNVYLLIGHGGVFRAPTLVQTVLGSCVSVTMHCRRRRCGGTFHAFLPNYEEFKSADSADDHFRYVDTSVKRLLQDFARMEIPPKDLECKLFGGAAPLHRHLRASVGIRNVQAAHEALAEAGLTVKASSVGGDVGRKILFRTDTGIVLQKTFSVRSRRD